MQRIIAYCEKYHIFEKGDGVILGLSGGADSVCLFLALLTLRDTLDLHILAVHVHHGIRGDEAERDAAFAKALCEKYNVEYYEERADIPAMAKELHMTEEEAGRYVRYQCFHRELTKRGYQRIAVAHHKNDQAETILFHMARGTGLDGLVGMKPVTGNVVRPLLCVTRKEIEALVAEAGEDYCIDTTNADTEYTRNYIRHEVVNRLEQINTEAVAHIASLSERMLLLQDYIRENADAAFRECVRGNGNKTTPVQSVTLDLTSLLAHHPYMRQELVRRAVMSLTESLKDLEQVHIEGVLALVNSQAGRRRELPYGIVVWRGPEELHFETSKSVERHGLCATISEHDMGTGHQQERICFGRVLRKDLIPGRRFDFDLDDSQKLSISVLETKPEQISKKRYTKYFDCGRIKDNLVLRRPEASDYFILDQAGHKKKLNRFFIDEKLPVYERDRQLVLADGHHVLWILGYRISEAYKVTEQTDTVVMVSYEGTDGSVDYDV